MEGDSVIGSSQLPAAVDSSSCAVGASASPELASLTDQSLVGSLPGTPSLFQRRKRVPFTSVTGSGSIEPPRSGTQMNAVAAESTNGPAGSVLVARPMQCL